MSKRLKLSDLAKVVAQKTATSASKGVVISEGSETTSEKAFEMVQGKAGRQCGGKKAKIDQASGASARPPCFRKGSSVRRTLGEPWHRFMMAVRPAEKFCRVILPAGQGEVDRSPHQVVPFIHALGQQRLRRGRPQSKGCAESAEMEMVRAQNRAIELKGALAEEKAKGKRLTEDADAKDKDHRRVQRVGRLLEAVRDQHLLTSAMALTSARGIAHQYPDLGSIWRTLRWTKNSSLKRRPKRAMNGRRRGSRGRGGCEAAV
ncbi:hypothetical protein Acr_25g0000580 [Actinidia rufa]|uniref:Uncharacterized protein n=1 Tax=Actinidia rufa TaxID=165716 RepID=A0A7J0GXU8_9ERIC|nr:hypothetical protein Acr_25g0000580 [Actinidia rufa]